jgi:kynurenine formamidase
MPEWPSAPGVNVHTLQYHAKDGVYVTEFEGIMHRGTHMDTPVHVTANTPGFEGYALWRFFGTGVAVSIPKGPVGSRHGRGPGARTPLRSAKRHRHDQYRPSPQVCRLG